MHVLAEAPGKGALCERGVLAIVGGTECLNTEFDSAPDIEGLLVVEGSCLTRVEPTVFNLVPFAQRFWERSDEILLSPVDVLCYAP
jgi:hypothetical protein